MIVITPNPVAFANQDLLVNYAEKNRLPSMYGAPEYVEKGGLLAYGVATGEGWRRAAAFADKILKGVRPADMPVEQPTTFEVVINLKAAKALGLKNPQAPLAAAHP